MSAEQILKDHGLHDSHWGKRIIAAEQNGGFNEQDIHDAANWVTCACGKVTHDIPRGKSFSSNAPKDGKLLDLGGSFHYRISTQSFAASAIALINIEKRAIEVVNGE